jgi:hypothetical protein
MAWGSESRSFDSVEAQFLIIFISKYVNVREALKFVYRSGEIHQFFRPKMRQ